MPKLESVVIPSYHESSARLNCTSSHFQVVDSYCLQ